MEFESRNGEGKNLKCKCAGGRKELQTAEENKWSEWSKEEGKGGREAEECKMRRQEVEREGDREREQGQ